MTAPPFVPHHALVGAVDAPNVALVLHGILGNLRNWRFYARDLAEVLPTWRFVLVDLRNHGESSGAPGPHTLAACAADLDALCAALEITPRAVIGHSFGGKVALTWAAHRQAAANGTAPEQVWVLDAMPDAVAREEAALTSDVIQVIAGLRQVALPLERRRDVVPALEALGFSGTLARWMTTNLSAHPDGGYVWSFELDAVEEMLDHYLAADLWPFLEGLESGDAQVHIVRALQSPRWPETTVSRLRALEPNGQVALHDLDKSGHWVHVDNPDGLRAMLVDGLGGEAEE